MWGFAEKMRCLLVSIELIKSWDAAEQGAHIYMLNPSDEWRAM